MLYQILSYNVAQIYIVLFDRDWIMSKCSGKYINVCNLIYTYKKSVYDYIRYILPTNITKYNDFIKKITCNLLV